MNNPFLFFIDYLLFYKTKLCLFEFSFITLQKNIFYFSKIFLDFWGKICYNPYRIKQRGAFYEGLD